MEEILFNTSGSQAIYQIVALLIFFIFFIGVIIWLFKMDEKDIKRMEEIPLDNDSYDTFNKMDKLNIGDSVRREGEIV